MFSIAIELQRSCAVIAIALCPAIAKNCVTTTRNCVAVTVGFFELVTHCGNYGADAMKISQLRRKIGTVRNCAAIVKNRQHGKERTSFLIELLDYIMFVKDLVESKFS